MRAEPRTVKQEWVRHSAKSDDASRNSLSAHHDGQVRRVAQVAALNNLPQ